MVNTTGSIIPLGDGLTGKTVLTRLLVSDELPTEERMKILSDSLKSLNIEMEYRSTRMNLDGEDIAATLQFYVFPGQRQKISEIAPTFDEILGIFDFLPAMQKVEVLLLVYDTSRIESLKSLESWLQVAINKGWLGENSLVVLVSHKSDLQQPDDTFVDQILNGIKTMIKSGGSRISSENVIKITTSAVSNQGILELKSIIEKWIGKNGKRLQ